MNFGSAAVQFRSKFRTVLNPINSRLKEFAHKIQHSLTSDRLKGTVVERWGRYWRNLYIDYKDVAIDVLKESKERPVKTLVYISRSCCYVSKHNPDECSFREQLLCASTKVLMVSEQIRNPMAAQHIKWLEKCYNEGVIRYFNLGLLSFMWLDNFDKDCALYKAVCPYLKPHYLTLHHRIVDIGFLDRWCYLEDKMKDYDVNEADFDSTDMRKGFQSSLTVVQ